MDASSVVAAMPLRTPLGESEDVVAGPWLTPPGEPDAMAAALRMPLGESEDVVAGLWLTPLGESDAVVPAALRTPLGESGAAAPAALRIPLGESDAAATGLWRMSCGEPDAGLAGGLFLTAAAADAGGLGAPLNGSTVPGGTGAFATPLRSVAGVLLDFGTLMPGARGTVPGARTAGVAELTGVRLGDALIGVGLVP